MVSLQGVSRTASAVVGHVKLFGNDAKLSVKGARNKITEISFEMTFTNEVELWLYTNNAHRRL